jgi:hypothetical protein
MSDLHFLEEELPATSAGTECPAIGRLDDFAALSARGMKVRVARRLVLLAQPVAPLP